MHSRHFVTMLVMNLKQLHSFRLAGRFNYEKKISIQHDILFPSPVKLMSQQRRAVLEIKIRPHEYNICSEQKGQLIQHDLQYGKQTLIRAHNLFNTTLQSLFRVFAHVVKFEQRTFSQYALPLNQSRVRGYEMIRKGLFKTRSQIYCL